MSDTIFSIAMKDGRSSRNGDFVIVVTQTCSFATTAMEFNQVSTWARSRMASGAAHRDRTTFIERFQVVLARSGGGIATKGSKPELARIVDAMKAMGMQMGEWSVPPGLYDGVEIKRRPKPVDAPPAAAT